jgi:ATP synthase protein I
MDPRENVQERPSDGSEFSQRAMWSGLDQASIMSVELMAAILTWAGIGWLVDRWLGTMPWFLAAGALIGNAAGLYLIWLRSAREEERQHAQRQANSRVRADGVEREQEGGTGDST